MNLVIKLFLTVLGIVLMIAGVLISPLPGPMGLPVLLIGLIVTLRASFFAKRLFVQLYERHPQWFKPLRRMLRKRAKVLAIIWHQMLRIERFFTRGRLRALKAVRQFFKRSFRQKPA